jgi:hypothetical protein
VRGEVERCFVLQFLRMILWRFLWRAAGAPSDSRFSGPKIDDRTSDGSNSR